MFRLWINVSADLPDPPISFLNPDNFNQNALIDKMNVYLKGKNRLQIPDGFCHGLTLHWFKTMAKREEQDFYKTKETIISCPDTHINYFEKDIEALIRKIDAKQNPSAYTYNTINYTNVDQILKSEPQEKCDGVYTAKDLASFFLRNYRNHNMVCISTAFVHPEDKAKHTIGVYIRDNCFYIFDPNYVSGRPKILDNINEVAEEIFNCLHKNFDRMILRSINLEIKLTHYLIDSQTDKKQRVKQSASLWSSFSFFYRPIQNYFSNKKISDEMVDEIDLESPPVIEGSKGYSQ